MNSWLASLRGTWLVWAPLLFIVVLIAGTYAFWNNAKGRLADGIEQWRLARESDDVQFEYDRVTYSGFPYRLQADFENAKISHPSHPRAWSWSLGDLRLQSLVYQPNKVLANLAGEHLVQYDEEETNERTSVTTTVDWGRAAVFHDRGQIWQVSVNLKDVSGSLVGEPDTAFSASQADLHVRPTGSAAGDANADNVDALLTLQNLLLPIEDRSGTSFEPIDEALIDVQFVGIAPYIGGGDLFEQWLTNGGRAVTHKVIVKSKTLDIVADGNFSVDRETRPEGEFDVRVGQHQAILDYFVGTGQLDRQTARAIGQVLAVLALTTGDEEGRIQAPLAMKRGRLFIGPAPVADLGPLF